MKHTLRLRETDLLDALADMVNQHCQYKDYLDSGGLSANDEAMRLLAAHGRLKIEKEYGRRVIGHWI